ncbi:MAG: TfoX/Sxy family protein [Cardiobacteriaceae bacterium]|nr:TfoX/Sxy family protein [Cardiobacteriaceae bacterium]
MAIDAALAASIRTILHQHLPAEVITEKTLFGGLAFMVRGHMCATVSGRDGVEVMLRIGKNAHDAALRENGVRTTIMRGREYRGYIDLDTEALPRLQYWLEQALAYNRTLKAKP